MATYEPTIGLEIHAELRTRTKMFCDSLNEPDEQRPNQHICPVCLAHPGALPVINKEAVRHVLQVGVALNAELADYTEFDRKNYFYPDLPKGYQLSQFEYPLVKGGSLAGVRITRVHLEEDTASSMHDEILGETTIDYNRAGVPLMELVTEPDIKSAEQAGEFAKELQLLLRYLGVSNANMEKGEMRVEANVSVAEPGKRSDVYVELKNINSFNTMERAVRYEISRQIDVLEKGGVLVKETRGWDDAKQQTFSQRTKEGSADYRYFPDPDLPSMRLSEVSGFDNDSIRASLPELPVDKRARYVSFGIKREDADMYIRDPRLGVFMDEVCRDFDMEKIVLASNYMSNDVVKILRDIEMRDSVSQAKVPFAVKSFRELIDMIAAKEISSRAAKDILVHMSGSNMSPREIAQERSLLSSVDTETLSSVLDDVMKAHASVVADYKAGKVSALEFLLGQSMKSLRGAGDPVVIRRMLQEALEL